MKGTRCTYLSVRLAAVAAVLLIGAQPEVAVAQGTAYAGSFLEIPIGARALGMGGAYSAVAADGSAFHWNPAGVSLVENKLLSGMYSSQYGAIGSPLASFYYAGFTMPVGGLGFSVNWVRLAVNDIPQTPDLRSIASVEQRYRTIRRGGLAGETFTDTEDAFTFSFARNNRLKVDLGWSYFKFPLEIPTGVNLRIIRQSLLDNTAAGIALDAGAMFRVNLRDFFFSEHWPELAASLVIRDIGGTRLSWDRTQRNEEIAQSITYGFSVVQPIKAIDSRLTLAADFSNLRDDEVSLGAEIKYMRQFSARLGANARTLTAGVGIDFNFFDVDYAYLASSETQLGQVHRIGLAFNLDKLFEQTPR